MFPKFRMLFNFDFLVVVSIVLCLTAVIRHVSTDIITQLVFLSVLSVFVFFHSAIKAK